MQVRQAEGPVRGVSFHQGAEAVRHAAGEYEGLRARLGRQGDVLTSPAWFLSHAARSGWVPLLALVRSGGVPSGAVLLHGRTTRGVSTGVFKSGELCGRGAVLGAEAELASIAETAAYALVRRGMTHTVQVTLLHPGVAQVHGSSPAERACGLSWRMRRSHSRLSLAGGVDGVLSRFSYKMRRNYRYYRRRAEDELGCRYLPSLRPEQADAAVGALRTEGPWPSPPSYALARGRALRVLPGCFSMGLQDRAGNWVSFLAGWREGDRTYVQWQLNRTEEDGMSFSTVMRNHLVEHEASRGAQEVVFVGETVGSWQRACLPDTCGDLLVMRGDVLGRVAHAASRALRPESQVEKLRRQPGSSFRTLDPPTDPPASQGAGGSHTPELPAPAWQEPAVQPE